MLHAACDADLTVNWNMTNRILHTPSSQAVFGAGGALSGISSGKRYVDMSTVDEHTSLKICEAITSKGGAFLEVGWLSVCALRRLTGVVRSLHTC